MLNRDALNKNKLVDIIWSPHKEDEFAAYDNDLYLFRVTNSKPQQSVTNNLIHLCDESNAELLANFSENSNPRIVAWNPSIDYAYAFAVNLPNHKIQLINFNLHKKKSSKIVDIQKEFYFKQVRQCKNMVWNPHKPNFLAVGFEKIRNEHSILVWDVRAAPANPSIKYDEISSETILFSSVSVINNLTNSDRSQYNLSTLASITTSMNTGSSTTANYSANSGLVESRCEVNFETGTNESCTSLSWNPYEEDLLLAGMNGKLKIYDTRSNASRSPLTINTKYVNSFTMDPAPNSVPYLAASFNENIVALWDTRRFDRPLDTITEQDSILKMQWSPTNCGKLSTLTKNSSNFNIYSIKINNTSTTQSVIEDDNAPKQIFIDKTSKRMVAPSSSPNQSLTNSSLTNSNMKQKYFISNFCWSRFDSNKIIYATNMSIFNLKTFCLSDTIVFTWSPNADLCWSSSIGRVNLIENFDKYEFDFITELKYRNALDYGLKYEIITILNGNATSTLSTHNTYNSSSSTSAIPLSLALNGSQGITSLIRSDFQHNLKYCSLKNDSCHDFDENLKFLWYWFDSINRFFEITLPLNPRNTQIELPPNSRNFLIELYWTRYSGLRVMLEDFINKKLETSEQQQNHDSRFRIITFYLCGWDLKDGSVSRQFFTNLENRGYVERAACLAVLTNNYEQALDILENASKTDVRYGCIWIAIKYFYTEQLVKERESQSSNFASKNPVLSKQHSSSSMSSYSSVKMNSPILSSQNSLSPNTKTTFYSSNSKNANSFTSETIMEECNRIIENFNNPYLKALFNFVLNKEEAFQNILKDTKILLQDRIALSVFFMYNRDCHKQLCEYFDYIIEEECVGNLSGILLTGLNERCIDLFQKFIDKTGDVQTVVMAIIHTPYIEVEESEQVKSWIESYRELLNKYKLWEKRAEFDILQMKLSKSRTMLSSQYQLDPLTPPLNTNNPFFNRSVTPKHQSYPNGNQYLYQYNTTAQNFHIRPSFNQITNQMSQNRHLSLNQNLNIHLACNRCGRNLMDKPSLSMENRNFVFSSHLKTHANTITSNLTGNVFGPTNHLSANLSNSNHYGQTGFQGHIKSFNINGFKLTEPSINGCLNKDCAKYLPQCVICLKYMKVNLIPSSNTTNHPAQASTNLPQRPQLPTMIPLNRSQSLYDPTVPLKILSIPMNSSGSTGKTSYENKINSLISPPLLYQNQNNNIGVQFSNGSVYLSNNNSHSRNALVGGESEDNSKNHNNNADENNNNEEQEDKSLETIKKTMQIENQLFLDGTKFGNWFSWCQTCKHGGHIKHLMEWFKDHDKCPFLHCKCECLKLEHVF